MPTRNHVKVPTAKIVEDMTRYMSYRGTPETPAPFREKLPYGGTWIVHRFQEGEYTYFRQPSQLNDSWAEMARDRYESFGVPVEIVKR